MKDTLRQTSILSNTIATVFETYEIFVVSRTFHFSSTIIFEALKLRLIYHRIAFY